MKVKISRLIQISSLITFLLHQLKSIKTVKNNMNKYHSICLILLLHTHSICSTQEAFKHTVQTDSHLYQTVIIDSYVNNKKVGFIAYDKMALIPFYVIHSFYVYPQYRGKGYGKNLLAYTCNYLKQHGAKRIYLQPGPFELDKNGYVENDVPTRELKLKRLIELYKKSNFSKTNKALSYCAALLYKCMHIDENSDYLMVKVLG